MLLIYCYKSVIIISKILISFKNPEFAFLCKLVIDIVKDLPAM